MATKSKPVLTEASILSAAVNHKGGAVLPLPDGWNACSRKSVALLKRLLTAGLIAERPTRSETAAWRSDEAGKLFALRITEAGRVTLPALDGELNCTEGAGTAATSASVSPTIPPRGKLGQVLAAVKHADGASIGDLAALTGWQAHTIRASLTRLRQSGIPISLSRADGAKRYVAQPTAAVQ